MLQRSARWPGFPESSRLFLVLIAALTLQLSLVFAVRHTGIHIDDERHYVELAHSIRAGNGFAFADGRPTSIRPPLYPAFVAALWTGWGSEDLTVVRAVQCFLSFGSGLLVFFIGRRLFGPRQGLWAAAIWVLYPSYLYANVLILTEVLFTFLVLAACLCALKVLDPGRRVLAWALVVGITIGLAALTRSVLWPFPLLLVPIIAWLRGGSLRERMGVGAVVLVGYVLTVSPWVVRNTNLQKTFVVVDTMGGLNLRMGNYEHTLEDRMWDGVALTGDQAWSYAMVHEHPEASFWTEGQREKWARQRAAEYMLANPMITARRAVLKFADFWGLEREYIAALRAGQYPAAPSWFRPVSSAAVLAAYVATMMLAGWGLFVTRWTDWRLHVIPLLIVVWICGIHTVVFGHSRYHLPIMPILIVYAAAALNDRLSWSRWVESGWRGRLLAVFVVALAFIWARDLFRDVDRIGQFLSKAFA